MFDLFKGIFNEKYQKLLFFIILLGVVFRFWGISQGLPYFYVPDEEGIVKKAMQIAEGRFDLIGTAYGPFFSFLVLLGEAIYFLVGLALGRYHSKADFASAYFADPSRMIWVARGISCVFGILTVLFVYLFSKKFFNEKTGLIASSVLALNLLHIKYSQYSLPDVTMALFVLVSVYFAIRLVNEGKLKYSILSGLFMGLASAVKIFGGVALVPFVLANLLQTDKREAKCLIVSKGGSLIVGFTIALLAYVLMNPHIIINFESFLRQIYFVGHHYHGNEFSLWHNAILFLKLLVSYSDGMGFPFFILAILGMAMMFRNANKREMVVMLSCPVVFFFGILQVTPGIVKPRYLVPMLSFLAVFSAIGICYILQVLVKRKLLTALIFTLLFIPSFYYATLYNYWIIQTETDPRTQAKHYVEEHIPSGTKLLLDGYWTTLPLLNLTLECLVDIHEEFEQERTKRLNDSYQPINQYRLEALKKQKGPAYYVRYNPRHLNRSLESWRREGYRYYVISAMPQRYRDEKTKIDFPEAYAFFKTLETRYKLIKVFKPQHAPGQYDMRRKAIEIWKLD